MLLFIPASLGRPAYYIGMRCFHQLPGYKLEVMVIRESRISSAALVLCREAGSAICLFGGMQTRRHPNMGVLIM